MRKSEEQVVTWRCGDAYHIWPKLDASGLRCRIPVSNLISISSLSVISKLVSSISSIHNLSEYVALNHPDSKRSSSLYVRAQLKRVVYLLAHRIITTPAFCSPLVKSIPNKSSSSGKQSTSSNRGYLEWSMNTRVYEVRFGIGLRTAMPVLPYSQ